MNSFRTVREAAEFPAIVAAAFVVRNAALLVGLAALAFLVLRPD